MYGCNVQRIFVLPVLREADEDEDPSTNCFDSIPVVLSVVQERDDHHGEAKNYITTKPEPRARADTR